MVQRTKTSYNKEKHVSVVVDVTSLFHRTSRFLTCPSTCRLNYSSRYRDGINKQFFKDGNKCECTSVDGRRPPTTTVWEYLHLSNTDRIWINVVMLFLALFLSPLNSRGCETLMPQHVTSALSRHRLYIRKRPKNLLFSCCFPNRRSACHPAQWFGHYDHKFHNHHHKHLMWPK